MSDGTKLFVYGVAASCPKTDLEDLFTRCGAVSDVFVTGKGYAFVTMDAEDDAKAAVSEYNGTEFNGQEIKVEIAHGRGSTRRGGGRGGFRGGDRRGGGYSDRRGGGYGDRRGYGGGERRSYGDRDGGYSRGRYGDRDGGSGGGYRSNDRDGGSRGYGGGGGGY